MWAARSAEGGVVFEKAGDADVEVRDGEALLLPVFEDVDVGEDGQGTGNNQRNGNIGPNFRERRSFGRI